jgi:hypothetical protein
MIKICKERWALKEKELKEKISSMSPEEIENLRYRNLVELTMDTILNCDKLELDIENIHELNKGDYQGTLLYLIPFDTYDQYVECEYLMTYVNYGSCSGCDTLLSIIGYCVDEVTEQMVDDLVTLCRHLIMKTINPYSNDGMFEVVKFEE